MFITACKHINKAHFLVSLIILVVKHKKGSMKPRFFYPIRNIFYEIRSTANVLPMNVVIMTSRQITQTDCLGIMIKLFYQKFPIKIDFNIFLRLRDDDSSVKWVFFLVVKYDKKISLNMFKYG